MKQVVLVLLLAIASSGWAQQSVNISTNGDWQSQVETDPITDARSIWFWLETALETPDGETYEIEIATDGELDPRRWRVWIRVGVENTPKPSGFATEVQTIVRFDAEKPFESTASFTLSDLSSTGKYGHYLSLDTLNREYPLLESLTQCTRLVVRFGVTPALRTTLVFENVNGPDLAKEIRATGIAWGER